MSLNHKCSSGSKRRRPITAGCGVVPRWSHTAEVRLADIRPADWLRRYLEIQRDGLTGHLENAGFPFDTGGWLATRVKHRDGEAWWPYEQTAYWIDGMARCGHLLRDRRLIAKAERSKRRS